MPLSLKLLSSFGSFNEAARKDWLKKSLNSLPAGSRILDAGAGELANKVFCQHLQYVSQDFCQYDGKGDNNSLQTGDWNTSKVDIVSDIVSIPEKDSSFDAVLCSEVLEHLPDPVSALKEFNRLLRQDGLLILTAPFCSLTHFSPYHFSSGFNRYFYHHHLSELGFTIRTIISNGSYFEYLAQELRRLPSINKTYTDKKLSYFGKILTQLLLHVLEKSSKFDKGSSELLCFGYHVIAKKL